MSTIVGERTRPGTIGENATRPDADEKVKGTFAFATDLSAGSMLWGKTLRSPHPYARIVHLDV